MSTDTFRQAAKILTDAKIPPRWLLPITPVDAVTLDTSAELNKNRGKAPGRYVERAAKWGGLGGAFIRDGISKDNWRDWAEWPTENVGILGRAFPAIDSDAESPEARKLVERVLDDVFGAKAVIGERLRGKSDRRLYAFRAKYPNDRDRVVRGRHLAYTLPGDDTKHKVDIIGFGNQYVATGIHPTGDTYRWREGSSLTEPETVADLLEIEDEDIAQFVTALRGAIEKRGGEVLSAREGSNGGERYSIRGLDETMSVDTVLEGLDQLPNNEDNFPDREDIVGVLAAIRAALGDISYQGDVTADIRDWACADEEWCSEDYFHKIWDGLDELSVPRDQLSRIFSRAGIKTHVKAAFGNDAKEQNREIKKRKKEARSEREEMLDQIANSYIFELSNSSDGVTDYLMRSAWDISRSWPAPKWWKRKMPESEPDLILALQENEQYPANDEGCANLLRDLKARHPDIFFMGEIRHPAYDRGEVVKEKRPNGFTERRVNTRYISEAIRAARKDDKNPKRSKADLAHLLDFLTRLFGRELVNYELDTLAYMAQTTTRPGAMLFMVGDSGVGKSLYANLLATLFDGTHEDQNGSIDGAKMGNESARRFILDRAEGCRILNIKELPEGSGARDMANVTATLKQMVDPGSEGDWLLVEKKGQSTRPVRNFARVIISSNYSNSLFVEAQDRRIFYVSVKITLENKPGADFYHEIGAIKDDPERLACFWRHLMQRDISNYDTNAGPPASAEKSERIFAEMPNPVQRHMAAAVYWLKYHNRGTFSVRELAELMTDCATAEYENSGGVIDNRAQYKMADENGRGNAAMMSALRQISKRDYVRLGRDLRTNKSRYPAVYVLAGNESTYETLMTLDRESAVSYIEREYDGGIGEHPMPMFRLPRD